MNRLTILGSTNPFTGYGKMLLKAAHYLEEVAGINIEIRALKGIHPAASKFIKERVLDTPIPDYRSWELIIGHPDICPTSMQQTAYWTMSETTLFADQWVQNMNKAKHVIVPTRWNAGVCCKSGVIPPVHVVPLGIDPTIFHFKPIPPTNQIIFGTAGSGSRKGIATVIRAFLLAFPTWHPNVRLKVKVTSTDERPDVSDPRIEVLQGDLTDNAMADWYASIHCFISGSNGEGWGLMHQEADCTGRLVLTDAVGGWWSDLFEKSEEHLHLCNAPKPYAGQWTTVDPEMTANAMKSVASEIRLGWNSEPVSHEWTWDRSMAELTDVLLTIGAVDSVKQKAIIPEITESTHIARERIEFVTPKPISVDPEAYAAAKGIPAFKGSAKVVSNPPFTERSLTALTPKYYHSGNLGDIIYGLYAIREHCRHWGADIIIGPSQFNSGPGALSNPITREQYDLLLPLLRIQKWIKRVRWVDLYPIREKDMIDMNAFRKLWPKRHQMGIKTLCEMQMELLKVRHKFDPCEPWLDDCGGENDVDRIVIHRSARWRQDDKMWKALTRFYRSQLLFVGLPEECWDFEKNFGRVSYYKPRDFLELAQLITSSYGFVGNQSFPMSLALALGQRVYQEQSLATPDCHFQRPQFWTQKDRLEVVISEWLPGKWLP